MSVPTFVPSTNPFRAVIWDYDGTLVETRFADEAAVADVVAQYPELEAGAETFWKTEGKPIATRLQRAWPGHETQLMPLFTQTITPRVCGGVVSVLSELRRRGYRLAVVSSRQYESLYWGLTACDMQTYFDAVVGIDGLAKPKPDPEGLNRVLGLLNVRAGEAVYIGDSPLDMEAGHRAGMAAWHAAWTLRTVAVGGSFPTLRHPHQIIDRLELYP